MKKYLAVFGVFSALFFSACSSTVTTRVAGVIKDGNGRPIEGAEVSMSVPTNVKAESTMGRSGFDGTYEITLRHNSSEFIVFSVKKQGIRRTHTQSFTHDSVPKGSNNVTLY